jgi:hypothetical protein
LNLIFSKEFLIFKFPSLNDFSEVGHELLSIPQKYHEIPSEIDPRDIFFDPAAKIMFRGNNEHVKGSNFQSFQVSKVQKFVKFSSKVSKFHFEFFKISSFRSENKTPKLGIKVSKFAKFEIN